MVDVFANIFEGEAGKKLALSILIITLAFGTVDSKTATICTHGCDFSSITAGIDAAKPGDTLEVHSGTYRENVEVTKPLRLIGIDTGKGKPLVDAGHKGNAITLSADGIILEGFNTTNSLGSWLEIWAGIKVSSNNNTIINDLAFNNENGVLLSDSSNNILRSNRAINNKYGIKIEGASNNSVITNDLSNNNYGMFLISSKNNEIKGNNANDNDFGLQLNASSGNILINNKMSGNGYNFGAEGNNKVDTSNLVDGRPIYYLLGAFGKTIDSTSNAGTVYCIDCDNVTVRDLILENNSHGIYLFNTTNSIIENNKLNGNCNGISLINSHGITTADNNLSRNIDGIVLISSRYNTIRRNTALDNDNSGFYATGSNYNNLSYNQARQNDKGLFIFKSGFNSIGMNDLSANSIAIYFKSAWLNDILNNRIINNTKGILLDSSAENGITGNKIFYNSKGLLYDPVDNNTLINNLMQNNKKDREEIVSRPTQQPPGSGPSISIDIDSKPKGAAILKDDEYVGKTPETVYFTESGNFSIMLSLNGYRDQKLPIVIPSERKKFEVDLARETTH